MEFDTITAFKHPERILEMIVDQIFITNRVDVVNLFGRENVPERGGKNVFTHLVENVLCNVTIFGIGESLFRVKCFRTEVAVNG